MVSKSATGVPFSLSSRWVSWRVTVSISVSVVRRAQVESRKISAKAETAAGQRSRGCELHFLRDRSGPRIESAAEQARKHQGVVHLVRVVRAAGRDHGGHVGDLGRLDLRNRVRQREHHGAQRHRADRRFQGPPLAQQRAISRQHQTSLERTVARILPRQHLRRE